MDVDVAIMNIITEETKERVNQPTRKKKRDDEHYIYDRNDKITMGWWPNDDE